MAVAVSVFFIFAFQITSENKVSVMNILPYLVTAGVCDLEEPVPCKTSGATVKYFHEPMHDEIASSSDFYEPAQVSVDEGVNVRAERCFDRCKSYCRDEGPTTNPNGWQNCSVFSSHLTSANTGECKCYGWASGPSGNTGYHSGWCKHETK